MIDAINDRLDSLMDLATDSCLGIIGFVIVLVGAFAIGMVILAHLIGDQPPSLFCPSGHRLITTPTTQVVGKVPTDGVRVTCE